MNSLQKLLQADKEALLKRNLKPAIERESYEGLTEAIDLAGGINEHDALQAVITIQEVWPMIDKLTPEQASGVVLFICARMHVMAATSDEPKEPVSAELTGLPTDRDLSPEGVEKTLEAARTGTEQTPGPGGPAGLAKSAPEDDLGELDPSKACNLQDGECESCQ